MPFSVEHDRFDLRVGRNLVDEALVVAGQDHRLPGAQPRRDLRMCEGAAAGVEGGVGLVEKHELATLPKDLPQLGEPQLGLR